MKNEVQILLAVHNGEKFLAELLTSLTKQQKSTIHLIVGFDNSSDHSESILQTFENRFESVAVYRNNFGNHNENFGFLFSNRLPGIPLAFCDQDDIWFSTKIHDSLNRLVQIDGPALATSTVRIMNSNTVVPSRVINSQISAIFVNPSKGCTQVLNVELQELIEKLGGLSSYYFYDWWVYIVAMFFGKVLFLPYPSIEYRIHQNNTIGQPGLMKNFKNHFFRVIKTRSVISNVSLMFLSEVREISRRGDIQLSSELDKLVLLLQRKRIRRISIFRNEFQLHPQPIKNYILKVGIIILPIID